MQDHRKKKEQKYPDKQGFIRNYITKRLPEILPSENFNPVCFDKLQ